MTCFSRSEKEHLCLKPFGFEFYYVLSDVQTFTAYSPIDIVFFRFVDFGLWSLAMGYKLLSNGTFSKHYEFDIDSNSYSQMKTVHRPFMTTWPFIVCLFNGRKNKVPSHGLL